jgi:hypothetical protein
MFLQCPYTCVPHIPGRLGGNRPKSNQDMFLQCLSMCQTPPGPHFTRMFEGPHLMDMCEILLAVPIWVDMCEILLTVPIWMRGIPSMPLYVSLTYQGA